MNTGSHSLLLRGMYELQLRRWMRNYSKILVLNMQHFSTKGVQHVLSQVFSFLSLPNYTMEEETTKHNTRDYSPMDQHTNTILSNFYELHNKRLEVLLGFEWKDPWKHNHVINI